jgi:hypothetical protein
MSLGAYFALLPVVVWMGVLDWGLVALLYGIVAAAIALSFARARWQQLPIMFGVAINATLLVTLSRFTSPFLIVPTMVVGAGILFAMFPQLLHRPLLVICTSLTTLLTPIVLEALGVWRSTWNITGGQFVADPTGIEFSDPGAKVFLIATTISTLIIFPMFVRSLAISQRTARRQLEIQAWHFHHLIPEPSASRG